MWICWWNFHSTTEIMFFWQRKRGWGGGKKSTRCAITLKRIFWIFIWIIRDKGTISFLFKKILRTIKILKNKIRFFSLYPITNLLHSLHFKEKLSYSLSLFQSNVEYKLSNEYPISSWVEEANKGVKKVEKGFPGGAGKKKKVEKVTEVRDGIYIGDGWEARYDLPVYA